MMAKKRTKYDRTDEEILNYQTLNQTSYVPTDELFKIFESNLDIPNPEILRIRYIATKISAYLGRKKDSEGRRQILSTGTGGFSYIDTERDVENLNGALEQMQKREAGIKRNIEKLQNRKFFVENQLTFEDLATN